MARGRLGKAVQAIDEDLTVNTFRLGIATYLRLFADVLSELLPFDRTIYLDCDVLVNQDLATLAKTEMTTPLVAAHDDQRYCDDEFRERLSMPTGLPTSMPVSCSSISMQSGVSDFFEKMRSFAEEHRDICKQHAQDAQHRFHEPMANAPPEVECHVQPQRSYSLRRRLHPAFQRWWKLPARRRAAGHRRIL